MKDTPLLMKGPLVCATMDGLKTQTRRLNGLKIINIDPHLWKYRGIANAPYHLFGYADGINSNLVKCPYGQPGDRLWVRETFYESVYQTTIGTEGDNYQMCSTGYKNKQGEIKNILYANEGIPPIRGIHDWGDRQENKEGGFLIDQGNRYWYKRPSIHMPRWASRITLEIIDIRVERVQDISNTDSRAEGVEYESADPGFYYVDGYWPHSKTAVDVDKGEAASFAKLWDLINLKRGFGWDKNPWVWVVEFKILFKVIAP